HAVRRPAGVADADVAVQPGNNFFKLGNPATGTTALHRSVDHRHAGGVVAPVFEAPQPLDQYGHDVARGYRADDSAHGQSLLSIGILFPQHHGHGLEDDLQVERERPAAQVGEVALDAPLHLLDRVGLAAKAAHLREAGDAGPHLVADHVAADQLAIELVMGDGVRPRADHAHAPLQHVDELRQLVERAAAQEGAEARDAAVVARRLAHHVTVLGDGHGAELVDHDLAAVDAVAALPEQDRAGRRALDADRD